MKENRPEPEVAGVKATENFEADTGVNFDARELLSRLPGVSEANIFSLINAEAGMNLLRLCTMSTEELAAIMHDHSSAQQLHDFLHHAF